MRYDDDDEAISFSFFSFFSVSFHKKGCSSIFLNFFKSHIYLFTKTIIQLVSLPNYRKASPPEWGHDSVYPTNHSRGQQCK